MEKRSLIAKRIICYSLTSSDSKVSEFTITDEVRKYCGRANAAYKAALAEKKRSEVKQRGKEKAENRRNLGCQEKENECC